MKTKDTYFSKGTNGKGGIWKFFIPALLESFFSSANFFSFCPMLFLSLCTLLIEPMISCGIVPYLHPKGRKREDPTKFKKSCLSCSATEIIHWLTLQFFWEDFQESLSCAFDTDLLSIFGGSKKARLWAAGGSGRSFAIVIMHDDPVTSSWRYLDARHCFWAVCPLDLELFLLSQRAEIQKDNTLENRDLYLVAFEGR